MKICVVHVTAEEVSGPYTELITKNFERAKGPATTVVHKYVPHLRRATDTVFAYPTLLNKVDVVSLTVEAEAEGCEAVMVACSGDTGVTEARTVVQIPVVGPMEAALLLACSYGEQIGIVTVNDPTWSSWMQMAIKTHGLQHRYAGLRQIETASKVAFTRGWTDDIDVVMEDVRARALELAAVGAEAIVIGSAGLSTMASATGLAKVGPLDIPIFDCLTVGLKTAELRAELARAMGTPSVSRAGWSGFFSARDRRRVDDLFEIPT